MFFFKLIYIFYIVNYNKREFNTYDINFKSSPSIKNLVKYLFYNQVIYASTLYAYNFHKFLYKRSKLNYKILVERFINYTIGFSYFSLSVAKSLLLCLYFTINDEKVKTYFSYKLFYRSLIKNIYSTFIIDYNSNKLKYTVLRIYYENGEIFHNPSQLLELKTYAVCVKHTVYHTCMVHIDHGDNLTLSHITTNPLKNHSIISVPVLKKNSFLVTNVLYNKNLLFNPTLSCLKIAESVGLHNSRYMLILNNLIILNRLIGDKPNIYQYYKDGKLLEKIYNNSFYELQLQLLNKSENISSVNLKEIERLIILREAFKNDDNIKKLLQKYSDLKIEGKFVGIYLRDNMYVIKTIKNGKYHFYENFYIDISTNDANSVKEEAQDLLNKFDT
jgi:hypothetical protein